MSYPTQDIDLKLASLQRELGNMNVTKGRVRKRTSLKVKKKLNERNILKNT